MDLTIYPPRAISRLDRHFKVRVRSYPIWARQVENPPAQLFASIPALSLTRGLQMVDFEVDAKRVEATIASALITN